MLNVPPPPPQPQPRRHSNHLARRIKFGRRFVSTAPFSCSETRQQPRPRRLILPCKRRATPGRLSRSHASSKTKYPTHAILSVNPRCIACVHNPQRRIRSKPPAWVSTSPSRPPPARQLCSPSASSFRPPSPRRSPSCSTRSLALPRAPHSLLASSRRPDHTPHLTYAVVLLLLTVLLRSPYKPNSAAQSPGPVLFLLISVCAGFIHPGWLHTAELHDLQPGVAYAYTLPDCPSPPSNLSFRLPPPASAAALARFIV